ncbi:kinetochore component CENP-S-domain-containing protein [Nemania serpens]|nr:kinetochore component CENP-S-domain-containing protein [Nemania serpens]
MSTPPIFLSSHVNSSNYLRLVRRSILRSTLPQDNSASRILHPLTIKLVPLGGMADTSDEDVQERLKAALWFAVGKMVDEETLRRNRNVTPQFIGALTEMVWSQIENVAVDLESFSRHAGRSTITTDDVLLLARRNGDLHSIIKDFVDKEKATKAKGKSKS